MTPEQKQELQAAMLRALGVIEMAVKHASVTADEEHFSELLELVEAQVQTIRQLRQLVRS